MAGVGAGQDELAQSRVVQGGQSPVKLQEAKMGQGNLPSQVGKLYLQFTQKYIVDMASLN